MYVYGKLLGLEVQPLKVITGFPSRGFDHISSLVKIRVGYKTVDGFLLTNDLETLVSASQIGDQSLLMSTIRDISARNKADQTSRDSEARLHNGCGGTR